MRKVLLAALCLLAVPSLALAQSPIEDCYSCVLGIFDEQELTHTSGTVTAFVQRDLFLGIKLQGPWAGLTGIEFSIHGILESGLLLLGSPAITPEAVRIGPDITSPADTSVTNTTEGGVAIGWPTCLEGSQALVRLTVLALTDIPTDTVLQVKRKYFTTDPRWQTPSFTACDNPDYTQVRVTGGCFIINPSGNPVPACQVAVASSTWSGVKDLYR